MNTEKSQDNEQTVLVSEKVITTLPVGTVLEEFEILGVIGQGGFGIVYRALDRSLEREVALKEYMPTGFAVRETGSTVVKSIQHLDTFEVGMRSFINEAKLLAKFHHPSLLNVYRFFEANGTAYMAMPLYENPTFKEYLEQLQEPPDENWLKSLLKHLLEALAVIHAENCYHRDISPDNILILNNGKPLLLDFGAARHVIQDRSHIPTTIFKAGYAPIEQCGEIESQASKQGAWTDFYALGAVIYFAIMGKKPVSAIARALHDPLEPLATLKPLQKKYSQNFLYAIDQSLAFNPADRPQNVEAFRKLLGLTSETESNPSNEKQANQKKPSKFPVFLSISLITAVSIGIWFGMKGELDVSFSDNSEIINRTLNEAQDCLQHAKFECAFAKIDTVLDIDPDNPHAQKLYDNARSIHSEIQKNISDADICLKQAQFDCVINKTERVLQRDPENLHAKTLRSKAKTQNAQDIKRRNTLATADECLKKNDYECALSLTDMILIDDPENETAKQIQNVIAEKEDEIDTTLQLAENCLKKSQFACVKKQLNKVFNLDPENAQAQALENRFRISQQQFQTIQKNLHDAETCLKTAQYECAISKAEVVLNFSPGNRQANNLRNAAKEKQLEAWKNSVIE